MRGMNQLSPVGTAGIHVRKANPMNFSGNPVKEKVVQPKADQFVRFGSNVDPWETLMNDLIDAMDQRVQPQDRNLAEQLLIMEVKMLLDRGMPVNSGNKYGITPLIGAARNGYVDLVRELLKVPGIDINAQQNAGDTALTAASGVNNIELSEVLLDAGAKLKGDNGNFFGRTPLIIAALYDHVDLVRLYVKHGADIHEADAFGHNVLITAAEHGSSKTVEYLMTQGLDPNQNSGGTTAWWMAKSRGRLYNDIGSAKTQKYSDTVKALEAAMTPEQAAENNRLFSEAMGDIKIKKKSD